MVFNMFLVVARAQKIINFFSADELGIFLLALPTFLLIPLYIYIYKNQF